METFTENILLTSLIILSVFVINMNFNLYHIFLHKEKERSFRLLNVFYGYLAAGWQFESLIFAIISLLKRGVLHIDNQHAICLLENIIIVR